MKKPRSALTRDLALLAFFAMTDAQAISVPAGDAELTIRKFVEEANISNILYEPGQLRGHPTRAVVDEEDAIRALRQMLEGSGLAFQLLNRRVISVDPIEVPEEFTGTVAVEEPPPPQSAATEVPAGHQPHIQHRNASSTVHVQRFISDRPSSSLLGPTEIGLQTHRSPADADACRCGFTIAPTGELIRGPYCKHEDGREESRPEQCPDP